MSIITINNKEYELEKLSEEIKSQLLSIQFVENELQRLNAMTAVMTTARSAYGKALSDLLGEKGEAQTH